MTADHYIVSTPGNQQRVEQDDRLARSNEKVYAKDLEQVPDEDHLAWLEHMRTPLEQLFPNEFNRYLELFYKYLPKKPFHVRIRYGGGFICQKGKKKSGEEYFKACYPGLIGKMLDYSHWTNMHGDKEHPPYYWIAMNTGRKSAVKAIDFDNKENLLGYYRTSISEESPVRPLPALTLEHCQAVKRLYDAFPKHLWCVSSATLGLHIWQKMPYPQPIEAIHAADSPRLREIGLGNTEIHPMNGRAFRRPFGQDYCTITDNGLLTDWIDQLDYFEKVAEAPGFPAIYQALRSVSSAEFGGYRHTYEFLKPSAQPHLAGYFLGARVVDIRHYEKNQELLDDWAGKGFPENLPVSEPVKVDFSKGSGREHAEAQSRKDGLQDQADPLVCDIDLSAICDGQWVQTCERWAKNGLPCADSIFVVVSHLSRWFYFVEWWDVPEDKRLEQIVELMTDYCLNKHNGFISRLEAGQEHEVRDHIRRIAPCAVAGVDDSGKWNFTVMRQKRQSGQYRRVICLEPVIRFMEDGCVMDKTPSSPVGFSTCCSDLENTDRTSDRRKAAEKWVFHPDNTPLPEDLAQRIQEIYGTSGMRLYQPTMMKIISFLNYLKSKGGEARLGVKSLAKMGFTDYSSRQHLRRLAHAGVIRTMKAACASEGRSNKFMLSRKTLTMFGGTGKQALSAG